MKLLKNGQCNMLFRKDLEVVRRDLINRANFRKGSESNTRKLNERCYDFSKVNGHCM